MSSVTSSRSAARLNRVALFDYGFRPFFLLAGLHALLLVPLWVFLFTRGANVYGSLPAMYWHAHEMLYGFVGAAIAGFLLTAVPSWTGERGFTGTPLILLALAWLAGRLAMAGATSLPFAFIVVAELIFLPTLIALLAPSLLRSRNRNSRLLLVLGALWLLDAAFLYALRNGTAVLASQTITLAIDLVLILVTIIGGRIVPAFTSNALRRQDTTVNVVSRKPVEIGVIAVMIAIAVTDWLAPDSVPSGLLAALAAVLHAVRLAGWRTFRTLDDPILWILHIGYAWLPIGLALKACWLLGSFAWALKWQHALTMGVFATMILAVMTRASLGHTGRELRIPHSIAVAYLLLTLAVLLRVFAPATPLPYIATVYLAAAAWTVAFLIYVAVYLPILIKPRVDGKPG